MPFPDWMSQYELCFPIASEHFGPAKISITPTGYQKDTDGNFAPDHRNRVYGLYVTARFEDEGRGFKYNLSDFVLPELFRTLEPVISESTNRECKAQLQGDDGYLDITFIRETVQNLRILCVSPSPRWHVNCLRLQLECHVNAEALAETRNQLQRLLELVEQLDTGSEKA